MAVEQIKIPIHMTDTHIRTYPHDHSVDSHFQKKIPIDFVFDDWTVEPVSWQEHVYL